MKPYILGWDLGGTKISVVLATERRIWARRVFASGRRISRSSIFDQIESHSRALLQGARVSLSRVRGIGISCPGTVNPDLGVIYRAPNLPQLAGLNILRVVQGRMKLDVRMDNDANCAALAEFTKGGGRGARSLFYVTVSTGIGGGLVLDGRVWRGASFGAGEIGHVVLSPGGPKCLCGKRGCLEALASGTALATEARAAVRARASRVLRKLCGGEPRRLNAILVERAARGGDPTALKIWLQAAEWLGLALAQVVQVVNPSVIALGGGVSKAGEFLLGPVRRALRRATWPESYRSVRVIRSSLGEQVGDWGAVSLWFNRGKEGV
ncbi:MAG: ROK family protein [Candidatus Omnitrophica bacterium]|nr:ROK family protein [Candidatus Omnitrophota bacterium]